MSFWGVQSKEKIELWPIKRSDKTNEGRLLSGKNCLAKEERVGTSIFGGESLCHRGEKKDPPAVLFKNSNAAAWMV